MSAAQFINTRTADITAFMGSAESLIYSIEITDATASFTIPNIMESALQERLLLV